MFKSIIPDQIYTFEKDFSFHGLELGVRMTVIKNEEGELLIHSPIHLEAEEHSVLSDLGKVKAIVAPNHLHHLFIQDFLVCHPQLELYLAKGLKKKRPDLEFGKDLYELSSIPSFPQITCLTLSAHRFLQETILFDNDTKTLILTDVIQYHQGEGRFYAGIAAQCLGVYHQHAVPLDYRLMIKDKKLYQAHIQEILTWDFERVILSHGPIMEKDAKKTFSDCFSFLFSTGNRN